ncbi:MAG: glycerol-3-phosphate acyltransferase [Anaerolineae bacterium]|nr:glycerol-3-phosphate acyltransferase [Anaerolineae bacterium]
MLGVLIAASYFIGSIPVAWLIARLVTGQDLRQMGSGNVGVMNTALSVARWAGLLVFLAEVAKGVLAVTLARSVVADGEIAIGLAVLATVVGTRWSIWLRGAGGRGNTVAMTALLIISWLTLASALALWLLARLLTGRSFTATRITFLLWPFIFGLVTQSWWSVLFGAIFSLVFLSTHRPETDDHLLVMARWPNLRAFLTAPRRK